MPRWPPRAPTDPRGSTPAPLRAHSAVRAELTDRSSQDEQFISEAIEPVAGTFDASGMSRGEPGLPARFCWRGNQYTVAHIRRRWKSSQREGGVGNLYLRRHWFEVQTTDGHVMTLYCQRQASSAAGAKARWWLYTIRRTSPPA